jgi:hypothetical protein
MPSRQIHGAPFIRTIARVLRVHGAARANIWRRRHWQQKIGCWSDGVNLPGSVDPAPIGIEVLTESDLHGFDELLLRRGSVS